jgi:ribosomal protein S1
VTDFGAFVELEEGIEGLIHVSEISREKVEKPSDVLKAGETVTACREHDYDTDGDVDLADFSAYQLAFAGVTR